MTITLNGTTGITNDSGYTGDGVSFADSTPANTLVTTSGGNVGVGTVSPASKLTVNGNIIAPNLYFGATTGSAGTLASDITGSSTGIVLYGSTASPASTIVFTPNATERMRIDSSGNVAITQAAGKYTIDTSGGATTVANGGTVDFSSASGMLVVNNHTSGYVTTWLCGGALTSAIGSVGGTVGTLAYVSGINGYRWTNNSGSSAVFGFFFVRTRTGA